MTVRERLLKVADEARAAWGALYAEYGTRAEAPADVQEVKFLLSDLIDQASALATKLQAAPVGHHPAPGVDHE